MHVLESARPLEPGLEALTSPMTKGEFLATCWHRRFLHVKGSAERVEGFREHLADFDVEGILRQSDLGGVAVQSRVELPQPHPHPLSLWTLISLYQSGAQLFISVAESQGLRPWIERLNQDLDLIDTSKGRTDVYATRQGGGAAPHYDANDNFTIQLVGRKEWIYWPEPVAEEVLHYTSTAQDGLPQWPMGLRERPTLESGERVILSPGDMLYAPRGFWHATEALEDSLSLDLNVSPTPWVEVVLEVAFSILNEQADWRATAMRDLDAFESRRQELVDLIGGLDLAAIQRVLASRKR